MVVVPGGAPIAFATTPDRNGRIIFAADDGTGFELPEQTIPWQDVSSAKRHARANGKIWGRAG